MNTNIKKSKTSVLLLGLFGITLSTFFSMSCEPVGHVDQYTLNGKTLRTQMVNFEERENNR